MMSQLRRTIPSSTQARKTVEKLEPISRRSSDMVSVTHSVWHLTQSPTSCGWNRTGTTASTKINRVEAGFNGGWVQIMGPVSRIADWKQIETTPQFFGLQQVRWR